MTSNDPRLATVWYRRSVKGKYERNHIEDGRVVKATPTIKHPDQSGNGSTRS